MQISIRPLADSDYAAVADIINNIEAPWQTNEDEARREDTVVLAAGGTLRHYVAVDSDSGTIVGHAVLLGGQPPDRPQTYRLELRVIPDFQRQGIGTELWQRLEEELRLLAPEAIRTWIRDCHLGAISFAQRRGFAEVMRNGPWTLDVSSSDLSSFREMVDKVAAFGVILTTLSRERAENPDCLRGLHQLRAVLDADIPAVEAYVTPEFNDYVREINAESTITDGFFIAKHGDRYIGMSCLNRNPVDLSILDQSITGVSRDWRHKGVAVALKCRGIGYARANGFQTIVTYLDSTNAPMSALNLKMGFRPGIAAILMERKSA